MERFWNIVYYFAYRAVYKLYRIYDKIEPAGMLIRLLFLVPSIKKIYLKRDFTLERLNKDFDEKILKNPEIGLSSFFALILVMGGQAAFILGIFMCFPNRILPIEFLIICLFAAFLLDYILIMHKGKYLNYFKEFDQKPREWKIKWAWISVGVILFQFFFFFFSAFVLNPYIKGI